jgi:hypothetical protein
MMFKPRLGTDSKNGVALIMVLGVLSLMLILALSFAIVMSTERLAAGNYADTVRARQLTHVGLGRALNDLTNMLGNGLPGGKVYPDWSVTSSFMNPARFPLYTNNILRGEATNYVPYGLWNAALTADLYVPASHWLAIESMDYTNDAFGNSVLIGSNMMGRVSYLILNCSSLIDANYAGSDTIGRTVGTNPAEIAIDYLGEIGGLAQKSAFVNRRSSDVYYETMGQLNAMADFFPPAISLFVYSKARGGRYWDAARSCIGTQVNLSGTAADMPVGSERWRAITNAFYLAGFSGSEAGVLYRNLIDYIDGDSCPTLSTTCVESVPMINEVVIRYRISGISGSDPYTYTVEGDATFEWWYPFVKDTSISFDLDSSVSFTENIKPSDLPVQGNSLGTISAGDCKKITRSFTSTIPNISPFQPNINLISSITLSIKQSGAGGDVVDQLNCAIVVTNRNTVSLSPSTWTSSWTTAECLDPRFNFDPNNPNQWKKTENCQGTPGDTNSWTASYLSSANDGDSAMYVANRPLISVAELGYLVYSSNAPWCTVKLYGPNQRRGSGELGVLDVFGLSPNASDIYVTNSVYYGLVNCNSNAAVDGVGDVFAGMRVNQYSDDSAGHIVTMAEACDVVSTIFKGGICTNLSDIGRSLTNFPVAANELQKESYFRNAFGLFNLRQNMFEIIIEAQVASGGNIPKNPARQKAVAIVWRDPFTGEMYVRHIRWLGD